MLDEDINPTTLALCTQNVMQSKRGANEVYIELDGES